MKVLIYRLLLLWLLSLCATAQTPFFLHRFRPRQHSSSLLSSASTSYPSFFPSSFLGSSSSSPYITGSPSSFFSDPSSFGSASNLHSLFDFGTSSSGHFDGNAFDQAELVDDYPGFSNAGFAKDLNFAGSHPLR